MERPKFKIACERCGQVDFIETKRTAPCAKRKTLFKVETNPLLTIIDFICLNCGNSTVGDNDYRINSDCCNTSDLELVHEEYKSSYDAGFTEIWNERVYKCNKCGKESIYDDRLGYWRKTK
jgi:predicted nucleic-acid-binding Zn-ribbon protein